MRSSQCIVWLLVASVATMCGAQDGSDFCNVTVTDESEGKFPPLPVSYSVLVEQRDDVRKNIFTYSRIKSNAHGGRIETSDFETQTVTIFSNDTQEVYTVNLKDDPFDPNACQLVDLTKENSSDILKTLQRFLHLYGDLPKKFDRKETVRGVEADILTNCQHFPNEKFSMLIEWAIANNGSAIGASSLDSLPLQIKTTIKTFDSSSATQEVMDLFEFRSPLQDDDDILRIPDKYVCANKKNSRPEPQLPPFFTFKSEVVLSGLSPNYLLEEYDYFTKLTRMDFYPDYPFDNYKKYGDGLLTRIHDYNMGVEFVRDNENNKCYYHAINETSPDTRRLKNTIYWRMADPGEFFHLEANKTFQYSGQMKTRGQLADVYVSQREVSVPLDAGDFATVNATFTWFFVENQDPNADPNDVKYIPIRMEYYSQLDNYDLNIFDFKTEEPTLMEFSVSECFENLLNEVLVMEFDVSAEIASRINKRLDQFKHWFELALGWNSQVSFLRVRIDEVTLTNNSRVSTRFTLFEKPTIVGTQDLFLKDAIELLNSTVNNESFAFWMPNDKNILDPVYVPKGSLKKYRIEPVRTSTIPTPPPFSSQSPSQAPSPTQAPSGEISMGKGLFAAVVILLLLGSLILGGGIVYLIYRKNGRLPGGGGRDEGYSVSISNLK